MNVMWPPLRRSLWILGGAATIFGIIIGLQNWNFSRHEIISVFTAIGVGILIYFLVVGGSALGRIERILKKIDTKLESIDSELRSNPGNPGGFQSGQHERIPTESPQRERPTGGGAFAGMIVGGAIGSSGGPPGVIIGGLIGALIGNFLEYLNIQTRRPPPD